MRDCRVFWCLGMFSSASTWLYNAALKAAGTIYPDDAVSGRFILNESDLPTPRDAPNVLIAKTHTVDGAALTWLARNAAAIFITLRDPRDAVASLMDYNGFDFGTALGITAASISTCAQFVDDPRATLFSYRDGFMDDQATIRRIAEALGGTLPSDAAHRIFAELRRPSVEAFIDRLETLPTSIFDPEMNDLFDGVTHWHSHHAGRTGRWRERLVPGQVSIIEARLNGWMDRFGDDPSFGYRLEIGMPPNREFRNWKDSSSKPIWADQAGLPAAPRPSGDSRGHLAVRPAGLLPLGA